MEKSQKSRTPYHDHLDVCRQCADHPFDLCPVGQRTIVEEFDMAAADLEALARTRQNDPR